MLLEEEEAAILAERLSMPNFKWYFKPSAVSLTYFFDSSLLESYREYFLLKVNVWNPEK